MSSELYIPPGCTRLSELKDIPQIRLGIQGLPDKGKTWAALTFPNPVVANLDRGLGAHFGRADVIEIPFHDEAFCKKIDPNYTIHRKKDMLLTWLMDYGAKLKPNQTLVWDGNTSTQNAYHVWYEENKHRFLTKDGKVNDFAEWNQKVAYFSALFDILVTLKCHVVYLCHEVDMADKVGIGEAKRYSGKIRPLMTGQMGDEMVGHFTDWFRQHKTLKPADYNKVDSDTLRHWRMTSAEFKAMCDSFTGDYVYYWQTQADDLFDSKASSLYLPPRFIPADYKSFEKWRKKISP